MQTSDYSDRTLVATDASCDHPDYSNDFAKGSYVINCNKQLYKYYLNEKVYSMDTKVYDCVELSDPTPEFISKENMCVVDEKSNSYSVLVGNSVYYSKNHMNCFNVLYKPKNVTQLYIHDVPCGQYTMRINGANVMTGKFDNCVKNDSNSYVFDFTEYLSNMFNTMCRSVKAYDYDSGCVDLSKFNTIEIFYPKDHKLSNNCFFVYQLNDGSKKEMSILPDSTYICGINFLTESITCHVTRKSKYWKLSVRSVVNKNIHDIKKSSNRCINEFDYEIRLLVNGELIMSIASSQPSICIRTTDTEQKFSGTSNNYIPEHLHKKLLNFSKIDSFAIQCINCTLDKVIQSKYITYDLDTREQIIIN